MRRHVVRPLLPWLLVNLACGGRTGLGLGPLSSEGGAQGTVANGGAPSSSGAAGSGHLGGSPSGRAGAAGSVAASAGMGDSGGLGGAPSGGTGAAGGVAGTVGTSGAGGSASLVCQPGSTRCGDQCVDLRTAAQHCGSCQNDCGAQTSCIEGECACQATELALLSHAPKNGAVGIAALSLIQAQLNCAFDPKRVDSGDARLSGSFSGSIGARFPRSASPSELLLLPVARAGRPEAFLPGERVSAWLGAKLGTSEQPFQPYSFQFIAEVSADSPGKFIAGTANLPPLPHAHVMVLGDLDADGDVNVVVRGENSLLVVLRNRGDATFEDPEELASSGVPVLGDVDGDGDLDIADGKQLLLNDGQGHFLDGPAAPGCVALGDVDGDGDLDCLANVGFTPQDELLGHVLFNSGDGNMVQGGDAPIGFQCQLWDLDSDGDLDAVCVSPVVTGVNVLINDGQGSFTATAQLLESGARAIALGDVDADGDIDLVVSLWFGAGRYAANQLYLNDGGGRFETGEIVGTDGGDIALADIDGDGDLDILYSQLTLTPSYGPFKPGAIHLNDGTGHFTLSQQTLGDPAFQWFELADLDGDRDLDAFVFHQVGETGSYGSVWLNQN